jgi:hypothetical protein
MTAAIACWHWRLSLAARIIRTGKSHVKMFGMSPPWPHLGEPGAVVPVSLHISFLIAAFTKIRVTLGSSAAVFTTFM